MAGTSQGPNGVVRRRVVCFGNRLHADDGFGCAVYDSLAATPAVPRESVFDAGTAGLYALSFFEDCDEVLIVDALFPRGCPGQLRELTVADAVESESALSTHAQGLGYLMKILPLSQPVLPAIRIIGVEARDIDSFRETLSAPVAHAVPTVRDVAAAFLRGAFSSLTSEIQSGQGVAHG